MEGEDDSLADDVSSQEEEGEYEGDAAFSVRTPVPLYAHSDLSLTASFSFPPCFSFPFY